MNPGFQCYVHGRGGVWHAICVDLDIAVDGASRRIAEESLAAAIDMHLEWASELPREERARFMARRVPWRTRIGLAARTRIGRVLDGGKRARGFVFRTRTPLPPTG